MLTSVLATLLLTAAIKDVAARVVFVIGVIESGTAGLCEHLRQHPALLESRAVIGSDGPDRFRTGRVKIRTGPRIPKRTRGYC